MTAKVTRTFRIPTSLVERFDRAAAEAEIDKTQVVVDAIRKFVEEHEKNVMQRIAGKKVDIDLDIAEYQGMRSAVQDAVHTLLIESGIDDDDIFQIRVEEEYHVKTGKDALGKPITEAEAYVVLVELTDQRTKIIVDSDGTVRV